MGTWDGAGSAAIGGVAGAIGMIGQNHRANQQHDRQKELMDIQNKNQQGLNQQGHDLQFDMWNKTNAKAQMEHYKEAGLNPGLMYGGSGAGGATTGSQGGGSAASGSAAAPMDIGSITQMMKAFGEIALNLSSENKNNSEVPVNKEKEEKTYQEGRAQFIQNVIQEYKMGLKGEGTHVTTSKHYGSTQIDSESNVAQIIKNEPEKLEAEIAKLNVEKLAKDAGIELDKERTREIYHDIIRKWVDTGIKAINPIELLKIIRGTKKLSTRAK